MARLEIKKGTGVALVRRINAANRAGTSSTGTYVTQGGERFRVVEARWTNVLGGLVRVRRPGGNPGWVVLQSDFQIDWSGALPAPVPRLTVTYDAQGVYLGDRTWREVNVAHIETRAEARELVGALVAYFGAAIVDPPYPEALAK